MKKHSYEEIQKAYTSLPQDLRDAVTSVEVTENLERVAKSYGLMMDKAGEIVSEAGFVMIGLTPINEFVPNLQGRLGVSKDLATKIAQDISAQVFAKVRASMKKVHSGHDGDESLLDVKEALPPERKDEVLEHLDEDEDIEKELKYSVSSRVSPALDAARYQNKETAAEDFKMSDLIKAVTFPEEGLELDNNFLTPRQRSEQADFKTSDLIKAAIPPDNLPVGGLVGSEFLAASPISEIGKEVSAPFLPPIPVPKPPAKPDPLIAKMEGIVRMPKEVKITSYEAKKDPYREAVG